MCLHVGKRRVWGARPWELIAQERSRGSHVLEVRASVTAKWGGRVGVASLMGAWKGGGGSRKLEWIEGCNGCLLAGVVYAVSCGETCSLCVRAVFCVGCLVIRNGACSSWRGVARSLWRGPSAP